MSKITLAPLPRLRDILKSIFNKPLSRRDLSEPWKLMESDISYWFLVLLMRCWQLLNGMSYIRIRNHLLSGFPTIFAMPLQLLRESSFKLHFYPITDELIPDWESCQDQAATIKPDIFFLVHYFGYPSDGHYARKFSNQYNSILG